ncbi:hypothetical protein ACIQCD_02635 [Streptomyces sp. NPDC093250]|uniref:hypothetical protein n=1 Tax=Streptomyces sp. NPDC093250 TaxID=3366036 RepID=UPI0037F2C00E
MTTVVAQALHTAATVLREAAPQDGMVSAPSARPCACASGAGPSRRTATLVYASGRPGAVEVPVGEGRRVVDLSRPWRNLAADVEALAESVDTARGGGTP